MQRHADAATPDWHWFEDAVSYTNARLSRALVLSGRCLRDARTLETGLATLHWLVEIQTSATAAFQPIGSNGFYRRGHERALFGQQPIEAQVTVSAAIAAFHATSDVFLIGDGCLFQP
jgi:hypothetical protein